MYQNKIDYLKRAIKRTYKRYIGERTDGKATIADVASLFNIQLDESRLEDYSIRKIDYSIPTIEIVDEKNSTSHVATYSGEANLLKCFGSKIQFINVVSTDLISKKEVLYDIWNETPIMTKLTFMDGVYELVFEKEMPHSIGVLGNNAVKMAVRYLRNGVYNRKLVKQLLLNKIYNNNYKDGNFNYSFERLYTYDGNCYTEYNNTQNKYTYVKDNNVVYGVDEYKQKSSKNYLIGICFESTNVQVGSYLPLGIDEDNFPNLSCARVKSAMIFRGGTLNKFDYVLEIYKENNTINIIYSKYNYGETVVYENYSAYENYSLPNLSSGTISKEEIQNILSSLQERLKDSIFMNNITNELNTFAKKIDIKNGLIKEDLDPLSPKLLINKSPDEIFALVSSNKDEYFKLISEQFGALTHINESEEKRHIKTLK